MATLLKQVQLERLTEDGKGLQQTTAWVDKWDKLKVGCKITLRHEPNIWWTVKSIGQEAQESQDLYLQRQWDVGGLDCHRIYRV